MKRSLLISAAVAALAFFGPHAPAFAQPSETTHAPTDHPADHPTDHAGADQAPGDHAGRGHGDGHGNGHGAGQAAGQVTGHGARHGEPGVAESEADAEHAGAGTEEHHGPPKPITWLDFSNKEQPPYAAMFINFVLLVAMYYFLGRKPVAEGLKNRRASIAKEIEEAQRMRKEAEDRAVIYQKKLEHLEEELKDTRAALIEAGKGDRDRIVREAEEKATRMEKDAAFLVEQEIKQLRADLMREAVEVAVTTAEELLKKRVTPVDQERLAEDYLGQLVAKNKPTASIPAPRTSAPPAPTQGGQS
jgi:F-type H+-transporting ATPase subunit b